MKILVDSTLTSYAKPAILCGFQAFRHDPRQIPTFDTFDMANPDVYLADADLLNPTVYKNIQERPSLKVCVVQKDAGTDHTNKKSFTENFSNLYEWINDLGHADIVEYSKANYIPEYKSDIVAIEEDGSPIRGIENIDLPSSIIFRIFSNRLIKNNKYCGYLQDNVRKHFFKSSRLSISEGNNTYNSIICGCYPISISDDIITELNINHSIRLKEMSEQILDSNTNFHALSRILDKLGLEKEADILNKKVKDLL
jgi:hypothetical protein